MNVVFRADSSTEIRTGHIMRCLTLADILKKSGHDVTFISRNLDGNVLPWIVRKGYPIYLLSAPTSQQKCINTVPHSPWLKVPWQDDAEEVILRIKEAGKSVDLLVVDHYALDKEWEQLLRPFVKKIFVIDDLADRDHDCELLLDQNLYENFTKRYLSRVKKGTQLLLGPSFAILRPQFLEERKQCTVRKQLKKILVFFGGGTSAQEINKTLEALSLMKFPHAVELLLGETKENDIYLPPHLNITVHSFVENIAQIMQKSDLCIGACGITVWERCALGLPSIVMTLAMNQEKSACTLDKMKIIKNMGPQEEITSQHIIDAISFFMNGSHLKEYSERCMEIVDGKGTKRILEHLNGW